jgi:hypothetical protein
VLQVYGQDAMAMMLLLMPVAVSLQFMSVRLLSMTQMISSYNSYNRLDLYLDSDSSHWGCSYSLVGIKSNSENHVNSIGAKCSFMFPSFLGLNDSLKNQCLCAIYKNVEILRKTLSIDDNLQYDCVIHIRAGLPLESIKILTDVLLDVFGSYCHQIKAFDVFRQPISL